MYKIIDIKKFKDSRGTLTKLFTSSMLAKYSIPFACESYAITFNENNIVRGAHYHISTIEIFHVLQGECIFEVIDNKRLIKIKIEENDNKAILIMENTPHRITSSKKNSVVVAISSKEYFENDTDTYDFDFESYIE
jgi:dTDP-4-dehydrorhamnose 3,5-epimerase-like enzyme